MGQCGVRDGGPVPYAVNGPEAMNTILGADRHEPGAVVVRKTGDTGGFPVGHLYFSLITGMRCFSRMAAAIFSAAASGVMVSWVPVARSFTDTTPPVHSSSPMITA